MDFKTSAQWAIDNQAMIYSFTVMAVGLIYAGWKAWKNAAARDAAEEGLVHTTGAIEAGPGTGPKVSEAIRNMNIPPEIKAEFLAVLPDLMKIAVAGIKDKVKIASLRGSPEAKDAINRTLDDISPNKVH